MTVPGAVDLKEAVPQSQVPSDRKKRGVPARLKKIKKIRHETFALNGKRNIPESGITGVPPVSWTVKDYQNLAAPGFSFLS